MRFSENLEIKFKMSTIKKMKSKINYETMNILLNEEDKGIQIKERLFLPKIHSNPLKEVKEEGFKKVSPQKIIIQRDFAFKKNIIKIEKLRMKNEKGNIKSDFYLNEFLDENKRRFKEKNSFINNRFYYSYSKVIDKNVHCDF